MDKILIVNAATKFESAGAQLNGLLVNWDQTYFQQRGYEVQLVNVNDPHDFDEEVAKFIWADLIIYHTPVWWFMLPFPFKEYLDKMLSAGYNKGMYTGDGRSRSHLNPKLGYGTGGQLQGRKYLLTTTWNAPEEAFLVEGELFYPHDVDGGVMCGFHAMNKFIGLAPVESFHLFDVMKSPDIIAYEQSYLAHLNKVVLELAV
ncbi:NAD(P)H-dependent oxidoreductase [Hymenobacter coccineus]|uniref:NADPH quinone reductase MdaB n=1 Tax=Hymenobacter coccineus TaxID=1908235 RepID=A0A1G1SU44_9BACT|nr:NAD(P)H-dependent oxidoreductase [Hymenobacter coccineus]OGX82164.1 NADPH quinone reductase MdaB [Hymenobacter coccineus]